MEQKKERQESILKIVFKLEDNSAQINIPRGFIRPLSKSFDLTTKAGRKEFVTHAEMAIDLLLTDAGCNTNISGGCPNAIDPLSGDPRKHNNSVRAMNVSAREV